MATFKTVKTLSDEEGLAQLNKHLATRSYINGYAPTKADQSAFIHVRGYLDEEKFVHVARWSKHIRSFPGVVRKSWVGEDLEVEESDEWETDNEGDDKKKKAKGGDESSSDDDDDDDMDFDALDDDDDDEDDEETKKLFAKHAEKIAAVQARQKAKEGQRKSNAKYAVSPLDDTTDLEVLEEKVRAIEIDGLRWLGSDLQDIAYGLQRLIIQGQIIDQKIPDVDCIKDQIEEIDECQSCSMLSFEVA